ncbi:MAG: hypothetical protein J6D36_03815 [Erysipelotrichaceae bacterium]|nr:hypothetical protein [Erysipelotrichaceae bacterium]
MAETKAISTKKESTTNKKTTTKKKSSSTLKLSADEKKMITSYRKCNEATKLMIRAAIEKLAENTESKKEDGKSDLNLGGFLNLLGK